jgi:hypothetical protein
LNIYTRREILADGLEFLATAIEADGTEKTTVTSGTISIWNLESGAKNFVVSGTSLVQFNDSTWTFEWLPSTLRPGIYNVCFELFEPGDVTRLYDEFQIETKNNNYIRFSIPTGGRTLKPWC